MDKSKKNNKIKEFDPDMNEENNKEINEDIDEDIEEENYDDDDENVSQEENDDDDDENGSQEENDEVNDDNYEENDLQYDEDIQEISDNESFDSDDEENEIIISNEFHKNIIENNHPLLKDNNLFDIKNKTIILKKYVDKYECDVTSYIEDNNNDIIINEEYENIVIDKYHKTLPILTKYEKSRILGSRANQINNGAKPFIEIDYSKNYDGYYIACEELKQKKIPFIIKRPLPSGECEFWNVRDLEQLH